MNNLVFVDTEWFLGKSDFNFAQSINHLIFVIFYFNLTSIVLETSFPVHTFFRPIFFPSSL